jgi:hypothetical protein
MRTCPACKVEKPLDDFVGRKRKTYCKPCERTRSREARQRNGPATVRSVHRRSRLRRIYGMTLQEYDAMHARQQGLCAICGQPEYRARQGLPLPLAVDHDHNTGRVRGLLCHDCNTGLGKFKDRPELVGAALAYLERA